MTDERLAEIRGLIGLASPDSFAGTEARELLAEVDRCRAALASLCEDARLLADRVRLLDNVIGEHHSASVMREEFYECPVCVEHGGVEFFFETSRLLRAARPGLLLNGPREGNDNG
jgi:hypothetical protein